MCLLYNRRRQVRPGNSSNELYRHIDSHCENLQKERLKLKFYFVVYSLHFESHEIIDKSPLQR